MVVMVNIYICFIHTDYVTLCKKNLYPRWLGCTRTWLRCTCNVTRATLALHIHVATLHVATLHVAMLHVVMCTHGIWRDVHGDAWMARCVHGDAWMARCVHGDATRVPEAFPRPRTLRSAIARTGFAGCMC